MCKLLNRVVYGKSETPKFIPSKNRWLYKNKWVDSERAYEELSGKRVRYTYELIKGNVASFGELDSFDDVVSMMSQYPTYITFPDLTQFSMQEVDVLLGIQHKYIEEQGKKIRKTIYESNKEIDRIQTKLWG